MNMLTYQVPFEVKQSFLGTPEEEFTIEGIAINVTTTDNGHKFLEEELKKSAKSLTNRPLLSDHDTKLKSMVGRVIVSEFSETDKAVFFRAKINDTEQGKLAKQLIKSGDLNTVSVGAVVESFEENEDENTFTPKGIKFKELSLVATPADDDATFTFRGQTLSIALNEAYNKIKSKSKSDIITDTIKHTKEEDMEEKNKETTDSVFTEEFEKLNKEFSDFKENYTNQIEAQTELLSQILSDLKELKESDADEPEAEVAQPEPEDKAEKVEVEEPTEAEPEAEPEKEEAKEPEVEAEAEEEPEEDEESVDEKSEYKFNQNYNSFTSEKLSYNYK